MNVKEIDNINILLLVVSLAIAIFIPFKLFLFSYAVLGPLHYITEINWLNKKKYFIQSQKNWVFVFIAFSVLISIAPILHFISERGHISFELLIEKLGLYTPIIISTAVLFAFAFLFIKRNKFIGSALALSITIAIIVNQYLTETSFLFGLFLPTLIHVYVFTLFFIVYGAMKSKSKNGLYLSFILLSIPFIITFIPLDLINYSPSQKVREVYLSSNMLSVSFSLANFIGNIEKEMFNPLSSIGIRIHIFIAFAYTYHYLNWFSKTSIIGWKNAITKQKAIIIGIIWVLSVGLYFYNFKTGFIALFFLSYLHVFLELPLNALTIRETFKLRPFSS